MKIGILNECFLDAGYLARLKDLGDVAVFENTTTKEEAISRLQGIDIAVVDAYLCPLSPDILEGTDKLKLIVLPHTGFAMIDLVAAEKKGIKIANAPGFSKQAVAEMIIGLMFAVNRKIPLTDNKMREEPFELDPGNAQQRSYWGFEIHGKTMGILGLGRIGSTVAELALGLGMKVIANTRSQKTMEGVTPVTKDELLRTADVVSINVTSGTETKNFISARELGLMKQTAILINADTGQQVDTDALYTALKEHTIGGAGLDGVAGLSKDHPILTLENVVLTPHAASFTNEALLVNLPELVVSAIEAFVHGTPKNLIN